MVFSSVFFLFYFFPIVVASQVISKKVSVKNAFLLILSLIFYLCSGIDTFPLILISIGINYISGLSIGKCTNDRIRKVVLIVSILLNIGLLFYYKYFNFFGDIWNFCLARNVDIIPPISNHYVTLPLGISFFTFQGLSYVIDVYRKNVDYQRNAFKVALYIVLFPQLVAGPIVRYSEINEQIECRKMTFDSFAGGLFRFILGLGKKVIIADVLGEAVDNIFAMDMGSLTVVMAWFGAIAYSLQIYFDFSGYSDMAIGLGKMFGFSFPENFNLPYISKSIREFWRRWHITLSSWFRDYLYIPLGGSRKGNVYINLMIVFLCTGIWHGASFTFIIWGIYHGLFNLLERRFAGKGFAEKIPNIAKWLYTITVVVIGWVIFRCDNLHQTLEYIGAMFGKVGGEFSYINIWYFLNRRMIITLILAILIALGVPKLILKKESCAKIYTVAKYPLAIVIFIISLMMIVNGNYSPFIYFRF